MVASIGWWTKSLHRKWLFDSQFPSMKKSGCLGCSRHEKNKPFFSPVFKLSRWGNLLEISFIDTGRWKCMLHIDLHGATSQQLPFTYWPQWFFHEVVLFDPNDQHANLTYSYWIVGISTAWLQTTQTNLNTCDDPDGHWAHGRGEAIPIHIPFKSC